MYLWLGKLDSGRIHVLAKNLANCLEIEAGRFRQVLWCFWFILINPLA